MEERSNSWTPAAAATRSERRNATVIGAPAAGASRSAISPVLRKSPSVAGETRERRRWTPGLRNIADPVSSPLRLPHASALARGAAAGGPNHEPRLAAILDRLRRRAADLPYQDLRRTFAEARRIDGDGGERGLGVPRVPHVVEADDREIPAGPEPVQHEPVQHAEGDRVVEAERRRGGVLGGQNPPQRLKPTLPVRRRIDHDRRVDRQAGGVQRGRVALDAFLPHHRAVPAAEEGDAPVAGRG